MQPTCVAVFLCAAPLAGVAQSLPDAGLNTRLTFSESLVWEDDTFRALSDLGFNLSTRTRNQFLLFDVSAGLEKIFDGGVSAKISDPLLALQYGIDNRQTALTFNLNYRESDTNGLVTSGDAEGDTFDLVVDEGTREDFSARFGLEFGREAPFGGSVSLGYAQTTYSDTVAPSLIDSETADASVNLRFEVTPKLAARAVFSLSDLDRDGGTDTRRSSVATGAAFSVSQALRGDVEVGWVRLEEGGAVARTVTDAGYFTIGLTQDRPNGTLVGSLRSDITENGRVSALRVDRALELPTGSLNVGLGASWSEDTNGVDPLYSLGYVRELPRGTFDVALQQNVSTNSTGAETLNSRLQLGLRQNLTNRDSLSAVTSLRRSDVRGGGDDTSQFDIGFDYSRALTDRWSVISGVSHRRTKGAAGARDTEDRVFIGLQTVQTWRR